MNIEAGIMDAVRSVVREEIRAALQQNLVTAEAPLSYEQAAAFLQCDKSTIGKWVKDGSLPAHGRAKMRRVYRADLLRALELSSAPKVEPTATEIAEQILSRTKVTRNR